MSAGKRGAPFISATRESVNGKWSGGSRAGAMAPPSCPILFAALPRQGGGAPGRVRTEAEPPRERASGDALAVVVTRSFPLPHRGPASPARAGRGGGRLRSRWWRSRGRRAGDGGRAADSGGRSWSGAGRLRISTFPRQSSFDIRHFPQLTSARRRRSRPRRR